MLTIFKRAITVFREEGSVRLFQKSLRFIKRKGRLTWDHRIRPALPRRAVNYNGVEVKAAHCLDSILPWYTTHRPGYEKALVQGIEDHVTKGDDVVIVGGGEGVSTVTAARHVGENGSVTTYEGGTTFTKRLNETIARNGVADRVTVQHAVVGLDANLWGESNGARYLSPTELPDCDVLILDCEGSEVDILSDLSNRPRIMIVETHAIHQAPEQTVRSKLRQLRYKVISRDIAERENVNQIDGHGDPITINHEQACEKNGVFVLVAQYQD